ncbi:uncharacterized protein PFL1_05867 [Pseudozyma flocculosa PF-1]|uniref:Uncharacterized protein n=1 Tax=Pseudozyma flocculosa PF-1 TaxID=1277687 RepID=A0A061H3T2_9BASI|nr:uncharacterized protein PFL1_05867 [Pseudozyma flocculosa PF-1]EPQ26545.1 hypothetical protein PFL1_05867 [Pseudozyma flocculosa PF-1]
MSGPQRRQQMVQQQQQQQQQPRNGPYQPSYGAGPAVYGYQPGVNNAAAGPAYGVAPGYGGPSAMHQQQAQFLYSNQPAYGPAGPYPTGSPAMASYAAQPGMFGQPQPQPYQQGYAAPVNPGVPSGFRSPYLAPNFAAANGPAVSSASSPGNLTPLSRPVQQLSLSTGHSPRPSAGKTRLQSFVFPRPSDPDASGSPVAASASASGDDSGAVDDGDEGAAGVEATTQAAGGTTTPASSALPTKPADAQGVAALPAEAAAYTVFHPGAAPLPMNAVPPIRPQPLLPAASMQRMGSFPGKRFENGQAVGYGGHRPDLQASSGLFGQGSTPATVAAEIALRYPALPEVPAMPEPPTEPSPAAAAPPLEDVGEVAQAYREYGDSLKGIIGVYKKRDELLRLRTEAVGFDPKRAWLAWEAGKGEGDESVQGKKNGDAEQAGLSKTESTTEPPHPILGVRLLQRVAALTAENDELGRLLEEKLDLADGSKTTPPATTELLQELQDAHRLIAALDAALTKAEARAQAAERALEVACVTNSTAIRGR